MKKIITVFIIAAAILILPAASSYGITAQDILEKMDMNRNFTSIAFTARMEIHSRGKVRTKRMKIKSLSDEKSIAEFINSEDDGIKYLKLGKELWIYFPEEEETIKISGHMLKDGMMGSDISYEDALESDTLSDKYRVDLNGEETYSGRECYVLTLTAIVRDAPYAVRKMWVDKITFVCWKEELFAKSGKQLKESRVLKVEKIGDIYFAMQSEMENKIKKNSKTIFILEEIEINPDLDKKIFSKRFLTR